MLLGAVSAKQQHLPSPPWGSQLVPLRGAEGTPYGSRASWCPPWCQPQLCLWLAVPALLAIATKLGGTSSFAAPPALPQQSPGTYSGAPGAGEGPVCSPPWEKVYSNSSVSTIWDQN